MKTPIAKGLIPAVAALSIALAPAVRADEPAAAKQVKSPVEDTTHPALLDPSLATERAPDAFRVKLETTQGDVVILVNRSWAPNGADRFYNLVKIGYFDGVVFYRAIRGFMVQGGFNGDPDVTAVWSNARIPDDPVQQSNTRGMVTFAQPSMPNARTTQFFINTADNDYLKEHGSFAPFGKVISGMDVVDSLYTGYGEGAPRGKGPSQSRIAREGNSYLKADFPLLDSIVTASVIEAE
ncbi:MAG: peptidylprolyl isomerase [Candidatus Sulfomarinibacteraceae bacterium]